MLKTKKGACFSAKRDSWENLVAGLQPSWYYTWGHELHPSAPSDIEFVPMIWGCAGKHKLQDRLDYVKELQNQGKITHLLGFNEPDGKEQANMTVAQCIEPWAGLTDCGARLGSPAAVHPRKDWMQGFMTTAIEQNHRVDFVAVHWYGNPKPDEFINQLRAIHKLYQLPIWITEFGVADWQAKSSGANRFSEEKVIEFMRAVLPRLDRLPFVERYSWFSFKKTKLQGTTSALYDLENNLTPLGEVYRDHRPSQESSK